MKSSKWEKENNINQIHVRRRERFLPLALRLERRRFLVARRALRPLRAERRARLLGAMIEVREIFCTEQYKPHPPSKPWFKK